jgi:hypothetical protein
MISEIGKNYRNFQDSNKNKCPKKLNNFLISFYLNDYLDQVLTYPLKIKNILKI